MKEIIPHAEALFNIQYEIDATEQAIKNDKIRLEVLKDLQYQVLNMTEEKWLEDQHTLVGGRHD